MNRDLRLGAGRVDLRRSALPMIVEATTQSGVANVLGFDRHEYDEGKEAVCRNSLPRGWGTANCAKRRSATYGVGVAVRNALLALLAGSEENIERS
jgi:hypothetical protein